VLRAFSLLYWLNTNFSRSYKYTRLRITECRKGDGREVLPGLIRKEMAEPLMVEGNLSDSNLERASSSLFRRREERT